MVVAIQAAEAWLAKKTKSPLSAKDFVETTSSVQDLTAASQRSVCWSSHAGSGPVATSSPPRLSHSLIQ
jgi:hypothetical protein